ncbi:uncharacterized protein LOC134245411 [Saccostrea cucullata]|uniref:uncharacterized protein LOC134245411 n=1 Tax=Saccostrea cuccullata TaxID=36930 RepID=UPI002ED6B64D
MKNTQLQTLQRQLDEINKTMSDIKDEIDSIEMATDTNDLSKLSSVTSRVHIYRNLPHKIVPSLPKFMPKKILEEELLKLFGVLSSSSLTSDKHGYSMKTTQKSPEAGYSPPAKQLLDEPETVITIDTRYSRHLYNVACLSDEEIWTRGNDSTMKLFSINQGSLLKSITTKSGNSPWDIAVTKDGDLVYTDNKDRTVNIVKNEKIEEVIRLQNWKPHRNRHITENRNLDICVTDNEAKVVVVVNKTGNLRFRYTGHTPAPKNKLFGPRGITTDSQSHPYS